MTIASQQPALEHRSRPTIGDRVVLRAEGLHKAFGGQRVLDGVDLTLHQGEVVLLRGENGSGKTTLLNILTGNLEPDRGAIEVMSAKCEAKNEEGFATRYTFPRPNIFNRLRNKKNSLCAQQSAFTPERLARLGIGRSWQDVRLFGTQSLRDNIAVADPRNPGENPLIALFAPSFARRREAEINRQADAMLARFGLAGRESSSADMISLGQSKRVAIARAVAAGAHILFLDEPLAGLDRQGIRDVLDLLGALVQERGLTLVIVEHAFNQYKLHDLVSTDWLLDKGRIQKWEGSVMKGALPANRRPHSKPDGRPDWFNLLAGDDAQIVDEPLPRGAMLTRICCPHRWKPNNKSVLEIKDLVVKRGQRVIIGLDGERNETGFNLALCEGEIAILQAPNGWGKSTLFDAICGNVATSGGLIFLNGSSVESMPPWIRAHAGLSASPSAATLFPSLKVCEAARLASRSQNPPPATLHYAQRTISHLSGGEKQRTKLRFVLPNSENPALVLLDEPFAMLDDQATCKAIEAIKGMAPCHALLIFLPSTYSQFS